MLKPFLYLGLFLSTTLPAISAQFIYINPTNGEDNVDCYSSNSPLAACSSLDWALKYRSDGTQYLLSGGTHILKGPVAIFENLFDIAFIGAGKDAPSNNTIIHCIAEESGFAFYGIFGIMWSNLTVSNCSSLRLSTSKNFHTFEDNGTYSVYKFPVALYFNLCANVTFDQVVVEGTPNGTGVVMYNTFGTNVVTNSVFANNTAMNHPYPGGGGIYVEFTYCIVGDMNCFRNSETVTSYFSNNTNSRYLFYNCTFSNNRANSSDAGAANSTYIVPYRADHVAFGRGGGLSVFVKGNASNNAFVISNCIFQNNSALWGGGLFVEFHDDTSENHILVENTTFVDNFCYFGTESGTAGGGMKLGHYVYGVQPIAGHGNQIFINYCDFENNAALDGGGLSISPTVENVQFSQVASVHISNTNFVGNYGRLGAALHIDRFVMIVDGNILNVFVHDCNFHNNSVEYTGYIQTHFKESINAFQTGAGAVYVNQVPISFTSQANFSQNFGSAIAAMATGVNFSDCTALFSHNTGYNGGAIALLGAAFIVVNEHSSLTFENNKAIQFGGAIYNNYIEMQNLVSYTNCFIRYTDFFKRPEEWHSEFFFYYNTDMGNRSSAIYTTSILPCSRAGGSGISKSKDVIFCWNSLNWVYTPYPCFKQIFSDVGEIFLETSNKTASNFEVEAFPGHRFTLPITVYDDLDTDIGNETIFSASVSSGATTYAWNKSVTLSGSENSSIPLQLNTVGRRIWETSIDVRLQTCPPGFKLVDKSCVCANHYIRAINCHIEKFQANISEDNWIGKVPGNDSYYFVSFCPPHYCSSVQTPLPNKSSEVEEVLCTPNNRKGIMCGECKDGFGVAINSPKFQCVNCSGNLAGNIVAYIASVYIPLGLLFSAIIVFNIRLTSGPAVAFILYSQVISGLFDLDADGQIPVSPTIGKNTASVFNNVYKVVYGVFNLQFVERLPFIPPLCVGPLNTLDILMTQYAVALSPLLMIILVLVAFKLKECCSNYCTCVQRRRKPPKEKPQFTKRTIASAIIPAFSAFLLLSYTKFSTISSYILLSNPIYDENGAPIEPQRVYYAGLYTTNHPDYQKYKATALIVYCTFVAIPPLLLLDFPRRIFEWAISKVDCLWRYYPSDKVQILLDTFQGCYKNEMRFFAGLYFLFRLVINVTYIYTHSWFDQYLVQQIACSIMVALLSICQPYNHSNKLFNVVDVLMFTNLALINALSNFLLSQSGPLQSTIPLAPLVIQYILLYIPLVYMIVYLIWLLFSYKKQLLAKISLKFIRKLESSNYRPLQTIAASVKSDDGQEERNAENDEALFERAQDKNLYQPIS